MPDPRITDFPSTVPVAKRQQAMNNYTSSAGSSANQPTTTMNATTRNIPVKARQLSHLQAQLAQLSANLADTDNLVRVTAAQAAYLRELGSWHAGLFMASSKVLGEDGNNNDKADRTA